MAPPAAQSARARRADSARDRLARALAPALGALALDGRIEAYCLPLGVISHLYRETPGGRPGNVSRFGRRLAGAGGFIDISQAARSVFFLGTFTAGADIALGDGRLRIRHDGEVAKFIDDVGHVTFSGERAHARGQSVLYITERCVLRLGDDGLEVVEIAPGVDLERDVLARMDFGPQVVPDVRTMDAAIFTDALLGLV